MNRRRLLRLGGVTLAGAALAGCSSETDDRVAMTDEFAFEPARVTVDSGTTLTWVNDGSVGHTVTAYADGVPPDAAYFASGGFDSESAARADKRGGLVGGSETYEHTFEVAGEYRYFCIPHESAEMVGTVTVRRG